MKASVRILSVFVAVVLLLSCVGTAFAAEDKPVRQMTDAELIAKYNIPNNWSRAPLIFALRTGLLGGKGGNNLAPQQSATRAEMAVILTRILNTKTRADLSEFQDVGSDKWYSSSVSIAMSLDVLAGVSANTIRPASDITREEVFVSMARAFGITGTSKQSLYRFKDWMEVSDWAATELAAMIDMGLVKGKGDTLAPKGKITRAELAQILYNCIDWIDTGIAPSFTGKYVLNAGTVPANTSVSGDLTLVNEAKDVTLENLTVTGRLIIQGVGKVNLTLKNCKIHELVLCREAVVSCSGGVDQITGLCPVKLIGSVPRADAYDYFIVAPESTVNRLNVLRPKLWISVGGTVKDLYVSGKKTSINGRGTIENLTVQCRGLYNVCKTLKTTTAILPDMGHITATRTDSGTASTRNPKLTVGLKLTDLPAGKQDATVTWTVDGKQYPSERKLLENGCTVSMPLDFSAALSGDATVSNIAVTIVSEGETFTYQGTVKLDSASREASTIRTQAIQAVTLRNTTFYNDFNVYSLVFSGSNGTVNAYTQATILKISHGTGVKLRLPDGRVGWVRREDVNVIAGQYYTTEDYSDAAKEYYVNKLQSISSSTGYMIWISLYTQRVNIFQGYNGNWKLIRTSPCSSGANTSPTPVGTYKIWSKVAAWNYEKYYCHHVTIFDESRAFHSRPTKYSGEIYSAAMGYPVSAGCLRMLDDDCIWIYNNIPMNTTVYIY